MNLEVGRSLEEDRKTRLTPKSGDCVEGLEGDERLRLGVTNARHSAVTLKLYKVCNDMKG